MLHRRSGTRGITHDRVADGVRAFTLWTAAAMRSRIWHIFMLLMLLVVASQPIVLVSSTAVVYLSRFVGFLDHFSPEVAMAGFRVLQGKPCFHPVDAADRYSSLHGPGAYLWNALFLGMRPDDLSAIFYSKLAGVVAYTLALVAVATSMMRLLGGLRGWIATGLVIGMAGFFDQFVYWNHPDPHLLGASALSSLLLPGKANTRAHTILFGVLGGWVFNLKIHAVLAFLPVAMSMIAQRRVAHLAFSIAMGLLVAMLPFCFADGFSASN